MNSTEVWAQVADLLEAEGWTKGDYRDDQGRCALGGLCHVLGIDPVQSQHDRRFGDAYDDFADYLGELDGDEGVISLWNDEQPDVASVIGTIRKFVEEKG